MYGALRVPPTANAAGDLTHTRHYFRLASGLMVAGNMSIPFLTDGVYCRAFDSQPLRGRFMTGAKQLAFTGLLAVALALTSSSPAWSHHSHAMFDHDKEVTITGTVSQWIFRNPHVFLYVEAKAETGETLTYTVEMSNITNMLKVGFTATTFKAGDKVTVTMHPLIDGRPGGNYIVATSGDGKQFGRI